MPTLPAPSAITRLFAMRALLGVGVALWACCASTAHAAGPTGLLNDTGQTLCDNGSHVMAACTVANSGDAATYKGQDGRFGRVRRPRGRHPARRLERKRRRRTCDPV